MCLFCLVSCTNSFLSVFINNSAHGKGEGMGGPGAVRRPGQVEAEGEPRSPASSRGLATEPGSLRGPV